MSDYICAICDGSAFPLWKDGELRDVHTVEPRGHAPVRAMTGLPRHGVIEYDDHEEWLVESDAEGASRIIARDVPRWFGRLVEQTLGAATLMGEDRYRELDADEEAAEAATWD